MEWVDREGDAVEGCYSEVEQKLKLAGDGKIKSLLYDGVQYLRWREFQKVHPIGKLVLIVGIIVRSVPLWIDEILKDLGK